MLRYNSDTQYNYAQYQAYEALLKYSEGIFPINPFKIISKIKNIKLYTYKELAKEMQQDYRFKSFSVAEIITTFPSDDGFIELVNKNEYILAYNDENSPTRIRWTLFHELGHYFCKHLKHDNKILFSNVETYEVVKEREANHFALQCSCPAPLILKISENEKVNFEKIVIPSITGMSKQVNENCVNYLNRFAYRYDLKKFKKLTSKFSDGFKQAKWIVKPYRYNYL